MTGLIPISIEPIRMAFISFRKLSPTCPKCRHGNLIREPRGLFLKILPKSQKFHCYYCDTTVVRTLNLLSLIF